MRLSSLVQAIKDDLPITARAERWMVENPDPVYSPEAIEFARSWFAREIGGKRTRDTRKFRASGMGKCGRQRLFTKVGLAGEVEPISSDTANIFATGNFLHLKWQMAGLTAGWLAAAEVPYDSEEHDLGGTADGVVDDGSLLEVKSANNRSFGFMVRNKDVGVEYSKQVGAYHLLDPTLTAASLLLENKDTGEWRELRVQFTDELMQSVVDELDELKTHQAEGTLPPMLPKCEEKEGMTYRRCPFRHKCPKLHTLPLAVAR